MPSSLHSTMLTELQGLARVHPVFEITLASTTYKFSEEAVISKGSGLYLPYVTAWSGFERNANHYELSLQIPKPSVTIYDRDRTLQKVIGGGSKGRVRNSAVSCYLRSNEVTNANHYEFFSGVVADYKLVGDRTWQFNLTPDVEALLGQPKIPYLTEIDFPGAPKDFLNQPLWIVYGKHSSVGIEDTSGSIACLPALVDVNGDCIEWIISYGQGVINRLFFNGVDDTTNWGFYTLERGGRRYQMGHYSGSGTKPTPDDTITVDMEGLFAAAPTPGSTTPFENPAACIRNFLTHFVYGSGKVTAGTAWESETGKPIDSSTFDAAETYFNRISTVMSKVIRADEKVITIFNDWCSSFNAVPFWSDAWEIAAIPEDEGDTDIYHDDRFISQRSGHAISDLSFDTSRGQPVNVVVGNYLLTDVDDKLNKTHIASGIIEDDPEVRVSVNFTYDRAKLF